jgi:hypothetical protein
MKRLGIALGAGWLVAAAPAAHATNCSMGCVEKCRSASGFTTADDVSLTCGATDGFSFWFNLLGSHSLRYYAGLVVLARQQPAA